LCIVKINLCIFKCQRGPTSKKRRVQGGEGEKRKGKAGVRVGREGKEKVGKGRGGAPVCIFTFSLE